MNQSNPIIAALDEATLLMKNGKLQEAIHLFRKIIEADPTQTTAFINLAKMLCMTGDTKEAAAIYEKGITLNPRHFDLLLHQAIFYIHNLNSQKALDALKQALKNIPPAEMHKEAAIANLYATVAYLQQTDFENAYYTFKTAVQLTSDIEPAAFTLIAGIAGNLLQEYSHESFLHCINGMVAILNKDIGGALLAYQQAIEVNPNCAEAYFGLGNALCLTSEGSQRFGNTSGKRLIMARDAFCKATELKPDWVEAHYFLSQVLLQLEGKEAPGQGFTILPKPIDAVKKQHLQPSFVEITKKFWKISPA